MVQWCLWTQELVGKYVLDVNEKSFRQASDGQFYDLDYKSYLIKITLSFLCKSHCHFYANSNDYKQAPAETTLLSIEFVSIL